MVLSAMSQSDSSFISYDLLFLLQSYNLTESSLTARVKVLYTPLNMSLEPLTMTDCKSLAFTHTHTQTHTHTHTHTYTHTHTHIHTHAHTYTCTHTHTFQFLDYVIKCGRLHSFIIRASCDVYQDDIKRPSTIEVYRLALGRACSLQIISYSPSQKLYILCLYIYNYMIVYVYTYCTYILYAKSLCSTTCDVLSLFKFLYIIYYYFNYKFYNYN